MPSQSHESSPSKRARMERGSRKSEVDTLADAIVLNIASFVAPLPSDAATKGSIFEYYTQPTADIGVNLQAMTELCRVFPSLASYWRRAVLRDFNFTTDRNKAFNVEEELEDALSACQHGRWDESSDLYAANVGVECPSQHPAHQEIVEWYQQNPSFQEYEKMLSNDLQWWQHIGAYYRPHEYGFLGEIQNRRATIESAWPAQEDAFSLYCDLAMATHRLAKLDKLGAESDGESLVYPVLMARLSVDITGQDHELIKHCNLVGVYWNRYVSKRWSGFNAERPQMDDEPYDDESDCDRAPEEESVFPGTYGERRSQFERLRRIVYDSFSDWRHVAVNIDEGPGPDFFIGESKVSGRWLGFAGQSEHPSMRYDVVDGQRI